MGSAIHTFEQFGLGISVPTLLEWYMGSLMSHSINNCQGLQRQGVR